MLTVTLYRCSDCPDCDQVETDLEGLQEALPHRLVVIDVDSEPAIKQAMDSRLPVVEVGPYRLKPPFSRQDLQVALGAAQDRREHLEQVGDARYKERLERGHEMTSNDRITDWMSNHYMLFFNALFFVFIGLTFLAPVLMEAGIDGPAKVIYKAYGFTCHQLAFRSWFLFGEQPAYPRALANVQGLITYGQATGNSENDLLTARAFLGNPQLGYKVAICERDIAIYAAILLFGLIFAATGRRIKSLPLFLWIAIGILPIAVDGLSQLSGMIPLGIFSWIPLRESTPLLRTLTGGLFGFTTAWYGYPYVEETMLEARRLLARKKAVIAQS